MKARKIQDSEIATAPPHVREIWDWLIKEVNHTDRGKFKRGQTMRSLQDIREGLKWFIGYRKMMYSKSRCEMAMKWLTKRNMIETTKTTRGMFITVINYDTYQDPKNYETNNESNKNETMTKQPSDTINKNDKKNKNEKKGLSLFENSPVSNPETFKERFYSNPKYLKYDWEHYYEAVKNWSGAGGKMKKDWILTAYNFARNDKDPKLITTAKSYYPSL